MTDGRQVLTEVVFSLDTGGAERIAGAIAGYMQARGVRTSVCSTHGAMGSIGAELTRSGIECVPLQEGLGGRLGRTFRLVRHLKATRTTVLHVHHFNMLAAVGLAARIARIPRIVLTEHSIHQLRVKPRVLRRARRHAHRADMVTVVHDGLAKFLVEEVGVPAERILVIPNGVDTTEFTPAPTGSQLHPDLPDASFLVGYVGRLHPDKDPMNLVNALAHVPASALKHLHVVLIGDGPLRKEVEETALTLGIADNLTLLGDRQDVPALLPDLNCFVLPSRTEGLPVALLEAMSCGLPVIATKVGGVPQAVGDAGILIPAQDAEALAGAMTQVAGDSELRERLGAAARQRAEGVYDRARMFEAYAEVLFPSSSKSH